uniref:hypothetical protein n=1 Tax=Variovorax sp. BK018 TaxID=3450241 RepID=UPI00403A73B7
MKPIDEGKAEEGGSQEFVLDEAFLLRVDHAMLMNKRSDPHRLQEVCRAAAEESRLASMTNVYGLERRRPVDEGRG